MDTERIAQDTRIPPSYTLFTRSCFSRSPAAPADCQGDACREIRTLDGHTSMTAGPGALLFVVTEKCHQLQFEGEVSILAGPHGERAVMHATADGMPSLEVRLPDGWTLQRETLATPLVLEPFGGDGRCFYNIIRDEKLQSYHQYQYASDRWP